MILKIKIKKLSDSATIPTRGSKYAAGYDLYADLGDQECVEISPHTTEKIGTGLAIEIPLGYFGAIYARSGIALKKNLRPGNAVGILDADFRGEVIVALHNDSNASREIRNGERIAQLIIMPYLPVRFEEVEELSDTERGVGGFGSTGA